MEKKKGSKFNGIYVLIGFIMLLMYSNGSIIGGNSKQQTSYDIATEVKVSQSEEKKEQDLYVLRYKDKYDKHYSDGLFFNDYSEEVSILTEKIKNEYDKQFMEFQEKTPLYTIEKDNCGPYKIEYFINVDIECYNNSLEDYRNKKITVEDIMSNQSEHIRQGKIEVFYFTEEKYLGIGVNRVIEEINEYYLMHNVWFEIKAYGYLDSVLNSISILELKNIIDPVLYLDKLDVSSQNTCLSNEWTNAVGTRSTKVKDVIEILEKRHNEEFIFRKYDKSSKKYVFAPKRDLSLEFYTNYDNESKYPAVILQKIVSKGVREILEKHDLTNRIVFFSTPEDDRSSNVLLDTIKFDFTKDFDEIDFVTQLSQRDIQTAYYYLYDASYEEIDYEQIKNVIIDMQALYPSRSGEWANGSNFFFVDISEDKRRIAIELFRDEDHTENYFEERRSGIDFSFLYKFRTEHEGFHFLDMYGVLKKERISVRFLPEEELTVKQLLEERLYDF